jgi:xanthine/uracil permease
MAERKQKMDARARSGARPAKADASAQTIELHRKNWILLGAGVICIVLGFIALTMRDITLAPILLLAGYLVLVPWGLVAHRKTVSPSVSEEP